MAKVMEPHQRSRLTPESIRRKRKGFHTDQGLWLDCAQSHNHEAKLPYWKENLNKTVLELDKTSHLIGGPIQALEPEHNIKTAEPH